MTSLTINSEIGLQATIGILKVCTKCLLAKPVSDFRVEKRTKKGLNASCKSCEARASRERGKKEGRVCIKCGGNEFYASGKCAPCSREYAKTFAKNNSEKVRERYKKWIAANYERKNAQNAAWHLLNKDKRNAISREYQRARPEARRIRENNRRAKKRDAGGSLSKGLAKKLYALQKGKCACCGGPLMDDYHLDHIIPLALGGANSDWNIQLLHGRCNSQKKATHPVQFMQRKGFLL